MELASTEHCDIRLIERFLFEQQRNLPGHPGSEPQGETGGSRAPGPSPPCWLESLLKASSQEIPTSLSPLTD